MLLCHTGLVSSSSVAGFGVSLSSVSFLLRVPFVVFVFSLFVVRVYIFLLLFVYFVVRAADSPYVSCSGYVLAPVLSKFMLSFGSCLFVSDFIFRFVVVHSSQVYLVWLYDHHPRRVLVASNRPPFVLIRPYIRIRATLLRIAASAKLSHVILRFVN